MYLFSSLVIRWNIFANSPLSGNVVSITTKYLYTVYKIKVTIALAYDCMILNLLNITYVQNLQGFHITLNTFLILGHFMIWSIGRADGQRGFARQQTLARFYSLSLQFSLLPLASRQQSQQARLKIAKRRGKIKREITSIRLARLEDNRIIKEGEKQKKKGTDKTGVQLGTVER